MKKQRGDRHQNVCSYPALENNDFILCCVMCVIVNARQGHRQWKTIREGVKMKEEKTERVKLVHVVKYSCFYML